MSSRSSSKKLTMAMSSPRCKAVSKDSAKRCWASRRTRRRSTTAMMVCFLFFSNAGGWSKSVTPLPLGVEGVERQRRLARSRQPGDHHQLVPGNVDVDVLQVVGAGASHGDVREGQVLDRLGGNTARRAGTAAVGGLFGVAGCFHGVCTSPRPFSQTPVFAPFVCACRHVASPRRPRDQMYAQASGAATALDAPTYRGTH